MKHGIRDWMLMHIFYKGLSETSKLFLDNECKGSFINTTIADAYILLDGLMLEVKIKESLEKAQVPEDVFDDRYELFNLYNRDKKVEEVKMLSEVKEPFVDLEKCSLHELISILQKFASDPSVNINQAGFGSYIANHVLKEKIARYNQEAMIPPKLGDIWIPKVLVTIGKVTHHAILDLGSSVSILSKELYEVLELKNIEKCSIELALADDSIKHALGKVSDVTRPYA